MDGVLNSHPYICRMEAEQGGMDFIDPAAVARLNRIVEATNAVVVITSSWRGQYDFQVRLDEHGFKGSVVGETPRLSFEGRRRGHEIAKWLEDNGPVESFTILDDDSDMEHLLPFLVKTSFWTGMLDQHVEPAIRMLLGV